MIKSGSWFSITYLSPVILSFSTKYSIFLDLGTEKTKIFQAIEADLNLQEPYLKESLEYVKGLKNINFPPFSVPKEEEKSSPTFGFGIFKGFANTVKTRGKDLLFNVQNLINSRKKVTPTCCELILI